MHRLLVLLLLLQLPVPASLRAQDTVRFTMKVQQPTGRTSGHPNRGRRSVPRRGRPDLQRFRLAHVELIEWMEQDYGFDRLDAYTLVGQVGESTVANIAPR